MSGPPLLRANRAGRRRGLEVDVDLAAGFAALALRAFRRHRSNGNRTEENERAKDRRDREAEAEIRRKLRAKLVVAEDCHCSTVGATCNRRHKVGQRGRCRIVKRGGCEGLRGEIADHREWRSFGMARDDGVRHGSA